jgi:hypothetical protein
VETILAMGVLGWAIGLVVGSPAAARRWRPREEARAVPWREVTIAALGSGAVFLFLRYGLDVPVLPVD